MRSLRRAATAAAISPNFARCAISSAESGVLRCTFFRKYKRLQWLLVVAATRCVASNILLQLCCGLLPGLLRAPDTVSIPAENSTLAIGYNSLRWFEMV